MQQLRYGSAGPAQTNWYLINNSELRRSFVVDVPPGSLEAILKASEDASSTITDILLTHTHWDHTVDCAELVRRTGARVSVHPADAYRLLDPMEHTLWPLPFTIEPLVPDRLLEDGQTIEPAGVMLSVLHTPGHTEGGLCFVDHEQRRVYAGDTLFAGSVGRTDLPGGDMDILVRSITKKLFELEDDYEVYSGHGPMTTIGRERRSNPFVGESNR
jgi:hydroxyacylglutathione hydrolase